MSRKKGWMVLLHHKPYVASDGTAKERWVQVGTMSPLETGGWSVNIDALPTGEWNGHLIAKLPMKDKDGE